MSYEYDRNKRGSYSDSNNEGLVNISYNPGRGAGVADKLFFELEAAEVIEIILTEEDLAESDIENPTVVDIGKARVRMVNSEYGKNKELLRYARPLDTQVKNYPLKHEIVIVAEYLGELYYTQKLNIFGSVNHNAFPNISMPRIKSKNVKASATNYNQVASSNAANKSGEDEELSFGDTFQAKDVKPISVAEGDYVLEGRFGNTIKFGSNPETQRPNIKIRNEQPLDVPEGYLAPIPENINDDGSSIWLVSDEVVDLTLATIDSEVHNRSSDEKLNKLEGRQIIITSDRIVWNAKVNELFGSAKRSINFMTEGQFTLDAGRELLIETDGETVITAPNIFLGSDEANEPVVLGNVLVELLTEMLNLIIAHKHPTGTGPSGPPLPPELPKLQRLIGKLESALSPQNFTL